MKWIIHTLTDIDRVAAEFLEYVKGRNIFALHGSMGVGKTTFVKSVAKCAGISDDVSSPTFAIVNEYRSDKGETLFHFDFYRINDISEALDFGYEEYFYSGKKCFIEWPEKIESLLPADCVHCEFIELPDGSRELTVNL